MKIILKPHSGLANRIRVMVSGIGLSKELNIPLTIIWEKDAGLNSEYHDLFRENASVQISAVDLRSRVIQLCMGKPKLLKFVGKFVGIDFMMFDRDMHSLVWKSGTNFIDLDAIRNAGLGDIYINVCNEFYFKPEYLSYFLPNDRIQNAINKVVGKFHENTVGLHIRRTDHKHAINESPVELFIEKMREEIQNNTSVAFYLATDDADLKNMLIEKFGSRILFSSVELNRNNADGMYGAMIDLYALASTRRIYGSYFSSYSDIAARIGNIPLIVVKK